MRLPLMRARWRWVSFMRFFKAQLGCFYFSEQRRNTRDQGLRIYFILLKPVCRAAIFGITNRRLPTNTKFGLPWQRVVTPIWLVIWIVHFPLLKFRRFRNFSRIFPPFKFWNRCYVWQKFYCEALHMQYLCSCLSSGLKGNGKSSGRGLVWCLKLANAWRFNDSGPKVIPLEKYFNHSKKK